MSQSSIPHAHNAGSDFDRSPLVTLTMRPERRLIGGGSRRHIDFHVQVASSQPERARASLAIGLVLDRSGSMSGHKLETARRAALAVLDRLAETDRVAAVIFDDQVELLQEGALATPAVKAQLRAALDAVEARGSTALHLGWLSGCRAIAPRVVDGTLTRCFLLTDGLANVGETDPERIAVQAADVRANAGVGTSTFGIGDDYAETLLGPVAVAGGGQFHHLRTPDDIARTFLGELGELLTVAAPDVQLEIEAPRGVGVDVVSPYRPRATGAGAWAVPVGDLLGDEDRHVVVRFEFHDRGPGGPTRVRGRLTWRTSRGARCTGDWQEVVFEPADVARRAQEPADPGVLHVVGVHHAERARRTAIAQSRAGDDRGARRLLRQVADRIATYAGSDAELRRAVSELGVVEQDLAAHGYQAAPLKEAYFASQASSRGQRDLRGDETRLA